MLSSLRTLLREKQILSHTFMYNVLYIFKGEFLFYFFLFYFIQHCFICRPQIPLWLGSNPGLLRLWHWQPDALTTRLDLVLLAEIFVVPDGRLSIVMGSSTLANIWKTGSFRPKFHIDFDIIIGKFKLLFLSLFENLIEVRIGACPDSWFLPVPKSLGHPH